MYFDQQQHALDRLLTRLFPKINLPKLDASKTLIEFVDLTDSAEKTECGVCLETLSEATMMRCCKQVLCPRCLAKLRKSLCPFCRRRF